MPYQMVTYQKSDFLGIINIDVSVNDQMKMLRLSDELAEICTEITWDKGTRVVIIAGVNEKSSSVEIDLMNRVSWTNEKDGIKFLTLSGSIVKLDKPIIAAINADAIAQGLELALACDIRIASETSCFGMSHIKSGLIPWDGGTQRLSRLVGKGKAPEMILTGEIIDAQEALRIGLVNKVVSKKELMDVAVKVAQEMASKGSIALRYIKEAIYKGMDMSLEQGLRLEADLYLLIHTSKDRTEGIQAFREKRAPQFEGK